MMDETILSNDFVKKARKVKLLLMDCDGVLTDGRLYFSKDGEELKAFHVHDGQGIVNWHKAGLRSGIITGRKSEILERRVDELGIHFLFQNSINKTDDFEKILIDADVSADETAYIGDDIGDLEVMKLVGLPVAVANAQESLKHHVSFVTNKRGGVGAIRELTNLLLKVRS